MPGCVSYRRLPAFCLTLALWAAAPSVASAAWLGFKNDTGTQVVVQLAVPHNGKMLYGPARTLNPGEVVWDNIPPGARQVSVFDPKQPKVPVLSQLAVVGTQDVYLSIRLEPARPPLQLRATVRLVPDKPTMPPGQTPPAAKPADPKAPPKSSLPPAATPPKSSLPPAATPPKSTLPPAATSPAKSP